MEFIVYEMEILPKNRPILLGTLDYNNLPMQATNQIVL